MGAWQNPKQLTILKVTHADDTGRLFNVLGFLIVRVWGDFLAFTTVMSVR